MRAPAPVPEPTPGRPAPEQTLLRQPAPDTPAVILAQGQPRPPARAEIANTQVVAAAATSAVAPAALATRREARIEALLARGDKAVRELRLTRPAGDNALDHYRRVLALDANNAEAKAGLERIGARYRELVQSALKRGDVDTAERHLRAAAAMDASLGWLAPMRKREVDTKCKGASGPGPAACEDAAARCLSRCP